ncbi:ABC transporter ATP-binding protein [Oscillatoria sp. CS-180]|uniref:ABC transporter ATP-binding protein n=1 Tax=Oscillatoria sp. CS-180 TaxID=3021720 RepID=UPI00232B379F|nr:ABC transporter ATP-binding protein [Oscillatoria sp. CS-180]MDB9527762.1 ABC transporter ATP-binding protein [Oscillatoria sp. CS-180]
MSASLPSFVDAPEQPAAPAVVQTHNLTKTYRTGFWLNQRVTSLRQCSLTVQPGETFGLLGPNGAGKTTLLKILLGIVRPTSGRATVLGQPIGDRTLKHRIGYLPENAYFYDYLTGTELLKYTAGIFGLSHQEQRQRIAALLDMVGLDAKAIHKKPLKKYSKGMLQRVGLAQALINDPEVVFLDEPMSGLDPTGRFRVREVIVALKERGKTIFFNSHVLSDVETICDRVALLDQGDLLCTGTLDELLGTSASYRVAGRGGNLEVLQKWLSGLQFEHGLWHGMLNGEPYDFLSSLRGMGGKVVRLQLARPTLEEFFLEQINQRH